MDIVNWENCYDTKSMDKVKCISYPSIHWKGSNVYTTHRLVLEFGCTQIKFRAWDNNVILEKVWLFVSREDGNNQFLGIEI